MSIFGGLPDIFTETLGEPVLYTPAGGLAVTINAMVVDEPLLANFEHADQTANKTVAYVRSDDVVGVKQGDGLVETENPVGVNRSFRIVEPIQPDGKGMTSLMLELLEG
ncbi:MAG TPA: hypothetical protein VIH40_13840 [Xanthobacteraceae bacterium]